MAALTGRQSQVYYGRNTGTLADEALTPVSSAANNKLFVVGDRTKRALDLDGTTLSVQESGGSQLASNEWRVYSYLGGIIEIESPATGVDYELSGNYYVTAESAEATDWSLTIAKDMLDITTFADASESKKFADGLRSGTGSVSLIFTERNGFDQFQTAVISEDDDNFFIFSLRMTETGPRYVFTSKLSEHNLTAALADKLMVTISLQLSKQGKEGLFYRDKA